MATSFNKMGPDWRDFLEAYARTLRRVRRQAFRNSMSLSSRPTPTELNAIAHDEATLWEFCKEHPAHPGVADVMDDLRAFEEKFSDTR